MKTARKILCLMMALAMGICLTACAGLEGRQGSFPDLQDETSVTPEADAEAQTAMEMMPYEVITAKECRFVFDDDCANHYDITLQLPAVKMDSADADKANREMEKQHNEYVAELEGCIDTGCSSFLATVYYEYSAVERVLSVCVTTGLDIDLTYRDIYSFDLRDGSAINSNDDMLGILELEKDSVYVSLKAAVEECYQQRYKQDVSAEWYTETYNDYIERTMSDENLSNALYFVKDGALYARVQIVPMAGPEREEVIVKVIQL